MGEAQGIHARYAVRYIVLSDNLGKKNVVIAVTEDRIFETPEDALKDAAVRPIGGVVDVQVHPAKSK